MNRLEMSLQQSIVTLWSHGWSFRRIARELGIRRETASKYVHQHESVSKPAKVPTGSESTVEPKPAKVPAGSLVRSRSQCEPWRDPIERALQAGLSAQRIYQDLVADHQFGGGYDAVKRFVRHLDAGQPLPFRRMECAPAQEMQVDFGKGAWIMVEGKRKRPYLFRVVLSHSRKGYSEVVWHQSTENFIRCLENALRAFGGVPQTIVIDNLRAAVTKADWFDPQLNPKIIAFTDHYRTVILPAKPFMPGTRARWKPESNMPEQRPQRQDLRQPGRAKPIFERMGKRRGRYAHSWHHPPAGGPDFRRRGAAPVGRATRHDLPGIFRSPAPRAFGRARRSGPDVLLVPPDMSGGGVGAVGFAAGAHLQLAHGTNRPARPAATGPVQHRSQHIHSRKRAAIENGLDYLLDRARLIGPHSGQWAQTMVGNRGPQGIRVLQGFLQLARKHAPANVEAASQLAQTHGVWHLHELRSLLAAPVQTGPVRVRPATPAHP